MTLLSLFALALLVGGRIFRGFRILWRAAVPFEIVDDSGYAVTEGPTAGTDVGDLMNVTAASDGPTHSVTEFVNGQARS